MQAGQHLLSGREEGGGALQLQPTRLARGLVELARGEKRPASSIAGPSVQKVVANKKVAKVAKVKAAKFARFAKEKIEAKETPTRTQGSPAPAAPSPGPSPRTSEGTQARNQA